MLVLKEHVSKVTNLQSLTSPAMLDHVRLYLRVEEIQVSVC